MNSIDLFDDAIVLEESDIADYNEANILPEPPESQAAIIEWLQPTCFNAKDGEYRKHLSFRMANTGGWLWESASLRKWLDDGDHGMLWLKGIPGSGKSSFAANLISELSKRDVPVLFFFFRQIIDANHSPIALLRDWLTQVLSYSSPLQAQLKKYLTSSRALQSVPIEDLWRHLRLALGGLQKVFCIVDALDEMDMDTDYEKFLQELAKLGQWKTASIKVAITSRPVATIERALRTYPITIIRLQEKFVDIDILTYVKTRLLNSSIPQSQYKAIEQAVPGRTNGIFLYAKLAMDAILKEGADVAEVLKALPTNLNHMYEDLLRTHAQRSGIPERLQVLILSWATHAYRPLRLLELADVINATQKSISANDLKNTKELVRNCCGPLLEILPNETICVVHHSLTEFLTGSTRKECLEYTASYPTLDKGVTHARLAEACISYLIESQCLHNLKASMEASGEFSYKINTFDLYRPSRDSLVEGLYLQHHFLRYSVESFHYHVRKAEEEGSVSKEVLRGLTTLLSDHHLPALNRLLSPQKSFTTPLHIAAEFGLSQFVAQLIQSGDIDINVLDCKKETPLLLAAAGGHTAMVRQLLAHGAYPNEASDYDGIKPIHYAANRNFHEIVDMLLSAGVSPLTKKTTMYPDEYMQPYTSVGDTPLMYAACYKHVAATKAFLPHLKNAKTVNAALA